MVIQHNLHAANSSRMLGITTGGLAKSAEKLSSGYRINRAADNAAGLAISEKMRRQIRGLTQASMNAQDGISLCQIADGALDESNFIVHRIKELSIQAANGTQDLSDREYIQKEIDQLLTEVDRIAETTEFNTINLLDGTLADPNNATGATPKVTVTDPVTVVLPIIDPSATAAKNPTAVSKLQDTLVNSIVPQSVKGITSAFPSLATAIAKGQVSSQIGLRLYSDNSDTLAFVSYSTWANSGQKIDHIDLSLQINVNTLSFNADGSLTSNSRQELEATIIHEMMHAFSVDLMTNGMVNAKDFIYDDPNSSKFPIWFQEGLAQAASGGMDWTQYNSGLGIKAATSEAQIRSILKTSETSIESGGSLYEPKSQYGTGYLATMYLGYLASGRSAVSAANISRGVDMVLSSIMSGYSLSDTIKTLTNGKYTSLHDFQAKFADDGATFVKQLVTAAGAYSPTSGGRGGLVGGNLASRDLVADTNTTTSAYKPDKNNEYVTSNPTNRNENSGGGTTNSDTVTPGGGTTPGTGGGTDPGTGGGTDPDAGGGGTGGGTGGGGGNIRRENGALKLHVGAESNQIIAFSIDAMNAKTLGIDGVSVLTIEDCHDTMNACDEALKRISSTRSEIGAITNRLEHTIRNLDNVVENTTAAESLIRDTDMASEMVSMSRLTILQSVGNAMLSQSSQINNNVLSLLS